MKTGNSSDGRYDRITPLKSRVRHDLDGGGELITSYIDYEDIKEAVLKFKEVLQPFQEKDYKNIFGDFEND